MNEVVLAVNYRPEAMAAYLKETEEKVSFSESNGTAEHQSELFARNGTTGNRYVSPRC